MRENYNHQSNPTLLVAHLRFANRTKPNKNAKELPSQRTTTRRTNEIEKRAADNSSLAKWRVQC